jgi:hypothetical protein
VTEWLTAIGQGGQSNAGGCSRIRRSRRPSTIARAIRLDFRATLVAGGGDEPIRQAVGGIANNFQLRPLVLSGRTLPLPHCGSRRVRFKAASAA